MIEINHCWYLSLSGFQLRFPRQPDDPGHHFTLDCLLRFANWQSVHVCRCHSTLLVLGLPQRRFPHRGYYQPIRLGLAPLALIANLDYSPHLDAEMRTFGHHRKVIRQSFLLLATYRPVDGHEPSPWRWERRQNGRHWAGARRRCRYGHDTILRDNIHRYRVIHGHTQDRQGFRQHHPYLHLRYYVARNDRRNVDLLEVNLPHGRRPVCPSRRSKISQGERRTNFMWISLSLFPLNDPGFYFSPSTFRLSIRIITNTKRTFFSTTLSSWAITATTMSSLTDSSNCWWTSWMKRPLTSIRPTSDSARPRSIRHRTEAVSFGRFPARPRWSPIWRTRERFVTGRDGAKSCTCTTSLDTN